MVASRSIVTRLVVRAGRGVPGQRPGPLPRRRPRRPDRLQEPGQCPPPPRRPAGTPLGPTPPAPPDPAAPAAPRYRPGSPRPAPPPRPGPRRSCPGRAPPAAPATGPRPIGQAPAQAGHPHRLPQQDRPGPGEQTRSPSIHRDRRAPRALLHWKGAFDLWADRTLDKSYLPGQRYLFHANDQPGLIPDERPRLGLCGLRGLLPRGPRRLELPLCGHYRTPTPKCALVQQALPGARYRWCLPGRPLAWVK